MAEIRRADDLRAAGVPIVYLRPDSPQPPGPAEPQFGAVPPVEMPPQTPYVHTPPLPAATPVPPPELPYRRPPSLEPDRRLTNWKSWTVAGLAVAATVGVLAHGNHAKSPTADGTVKDTAPSAHTHTGKHHGGQPGGGTSTDTASPSTATASPSASTAPEVLKSVPTNVQFSAPECSGTNVDFLNSGTDSKTGQPYQTNIPIVPHFLNRKHPDLARGTNVVFGTLTGNLVLQSCLEDTTAIQFDGAASTPGHAVYTVDLSKEKVTPNKDGLTNLMNWAVDLDTKKKLLAAMQAKHPNNTTMKDVRAFRKRVKAFIAPVLNLNLLEGMKWVRANYHTAIAKNEMTAVRAGLRDELRGHYKLNTVKFIPLNPDPKLTFYINHVKKSLRSGPFDYLADKAHVSAIVTNSATGEQLNAESQ